MALHYFAAGDLTSGGSCATTSVVPWTTPLSTVVRDFFQTSSGPPAAECYREAMGLTDATGAQLPDPQFVTAYPAYPAVYDSAEAYYAPHHKAAYTTSDGFGSSASFVQTLKTGAALVTTTFADWLATQ